MDIIIIINGFRKVILALENEKENLTTNLKISKSVRNESVDNVQSQRLSQLLTRQVRCKVHQISYLYNTIYIFHNTPKKHSNLMIRDLVIYI